MNMKQHVQRVKKKYGTFMRLETVLPSAHIFAQMFFAEDYKCST